MSSISPSLKFFHPLVSQWFGNTYGNPTDIQNQSWPRIARGEHVLITAPTGSGKTLTAFLWAVNQLVSETWSGGVPRILYVSPLKALNNDIQRNLHEPLDGIQAQGHAKNQPLPVIRVLTRSGDTPQSDRRRMLKQPPEILITTPESLNLMLSSKGGRSILTGLKTVILDEIHSVFGNKRGTYLISAVDRLVRLSGEFQRISLSATINPMEEVAAFVGGYRREGHPTASSYKARKVSVIRSVTGKQYDVRIEIPDDVVNRPQDKSIWEPLAETFHRYLRRNKSTLIFTNSRKLCEKLAFLINLRQREPVAYSHHGSLSKEIRHEVETKLKQGELKAIVATSSLEMGIDIGALDEVFLVQTPPSVSAAVQRIGRAGHHVGTVSRGIIFPSHPMDTITSAVVAEAIVQQDIERASAPICPLDVLAQVIVSMVGVEDHETDELFAELKTSYPFHPLTRLQYDLVLNMLAGRYVETRIRELKPRIAIDRLHNRLTARKGALMSLYLSGGVIPDRGYYNLRHNDTQARIGELDEEFVWEARKGQVFTLGNQDWKIRHITHNDVLVVPARASKAPPPFWKAEETNRDFHLSEKIGLFLENINDQLNQSGLAERLAAQFILNKHAANDIIQFLKYQKARTGCDLPHRHHLVLEWINAGPGGGPGSQLVIHTMWGGRVNRPFALVLEAIWAEEFGYRIEVFAANDCIAMQLPKAFSSDRFIRLITSADVDALIRKRLESTGFFGARFRESCGRALLLTRRKIGERMPLWMTRLRSQKLLESVSKYTDFPILLETWRTCLKDEFDMENLRCVLTEVAEGTIRWTRIHNSNPSPMALTGAWRQVNDYMYRDDSPSGLGTSALSEDLMRQVVFTPGLRPTISGALIRGFEEKRQRLAPGYAPGSAMELVEWVKERLLIPQAEWESLLKAVTRDHGIHIPDLMGVMMVHLICICVRKPDPSAGEAVYIAAIQDAARLVAFFWDGATDDIRYASLDGKPVTAPAISEARSVGNTMNDAMDVLSSVSQWLSYYGPLTMVFISDALTLPEHVLQTHMNNLMDDNAVISGQLVKDTGDITFCDSDNFEILLRMNRAAQSKAFEPLDLAKLPLFLAQWQGLTRQTDNRDGLHDIMVQLSGYAAPAELWETAFIPARVPSYDPLWLDALMNENRMMWKGRENKQVLFCVHDDMDLIAPETNSDVSALETGENKIPSEDRDSPTAPEVLPDTYGRYDFASLLRLSDISGSDLWNRIWERVWAGNLTNDTFMSVRKAIEWKFTLATGRKMTAAGPYKRRRGYRKPLKSSNDRGMMVPGNWYAIEPPVQCSDLLEVEELKKDRVRLLLDRYGILFREILKKELPVFRWTSIFRTLRLMELSGEIIGGLFFDQLPGPQFISRQAWRTLNNNLPESAIYWMSAVDPASLCGYGLGGLPADLPTRLPGNHIVYHGSRRVVVSRRHGGSLKISVPPDHEHMVEYLSFMNHLLTRCIDPLKYIDIAEINELPAAKSPYLDTLRTLFDVNVEHKKVVVFRKMQ